MAWNDIPEFDSASSSQDDNPFTRGRASQTGKVSRVTRNFLLKFPGDSTWGEIIHGLE